IYWSRTMQGKLRIALHHEQSSYPPVSEEKMENLEATFRIVTPMFVGGADQTPSDGIRPPSVKGALRFWWRALNWGRFRKEKSDEEALKALHKEEGRLFGAAAKMEKGRQVGGQGVFLLEVISQPSSKTTVSDWPRSNTGAGYMAYGILESKGVKNGLPQPHRIGIQEAQDFILQIRFRPNISKKDKNSILSALNAWGLFGGLGSRSRRGMGSVTQMLSPTEPLPTRQAYEKQVKAVIDSLSDVALPPYTAISKESHFCVLFEGGNARSVLDQAGQKYKDFRENLDLKERIPFGLPLKKEDEINRRSSPLLFHVHALNNKRFVSSVLYLPASPFHLAHPRINMIKVAAFAQGEKP
ncbi:MAG: type III-B CRISPR module RAMP protein Cmr1, partial [Nitrospirota bacterium]|nr:type III-B CRISPR module RAMP protein Cmr1 [Nitrospirota bacterium]